MVCGICGANTNAITQTISGTRRRIYRCSSGTHARRTADILDNAISELVIARLATAAPQVAQGGLPADPGAEVAVLEERRKQLGAMFADGTLDAEAYAAASTPLAAKIADAKARAAQIDYDANPLDEFRGEDEAAIRARWDATSTEKKRAIIRRLFTIRLHPVGKGRPSHPLAGVEVEAIA
jgi:hypothetical protein